ncbi:MAG: hypothetical protein A2017_20830 [Lentisphaerae bacterium GWF2_44_16]|nr:MAG: hypothetical protein A2017_20830 [Lentisphaerae bacterium GWF2_44_16]
MSDKNAGNITECPLFGSKIVNSDTISVAREGSEYRFNLIKGKEEEETSTSSSSEVYLCKITGGTTAAGYTVDIYGNGYDSAATDTGTLQVLDLAQSDDLPTGTRVLGHSTSLTITGGSEA